jgi:glycosyltransferase involved in cell wall biosynthesis
MMLKIVQIQYSTTSGGSSALRLQKAFIQHGISSLIVSLLKDKHPLEGITYLKKRERLVAKIGNKMSSILTKQGNKDYGLFSIPVFGNDISKKPAIKSADIIYVHWVQNGFLSINNIEKIAKLNKPVIFIMHDMWSITGGCHYSFDCEKYTSGCKDCPVFSQTPKNTLAAIEFSKKLKVFSKYQNLYFVSPSKWLYNCAKQSLLTRDKPVFYIPNILDTTVFKPMDKAIAKHILNIENDKRVIAFGAVSIDSTRKGWPYLQKALEILKHNDDFDKVIILIFGSDYNMDVANAIPFETKFMGYLNDEYSTSLAYNASDVFIVPSLADNQPTTVQESLSCGTPVVGFNIGGIPDMIIHKENGYLAAYKNSEDIATGIKYCLKNQLKGRMLEVFQQTVTIQKHLSLLENADPLTAVKDHKEINL